jgi:hypothetical protein
MYDGEEHQDCHEPPEVAAVAEQGQAAAPKRPDEAYEVTDAEIGERQGNTRPAQLPVAAALLMSAWPRPALKSPGSFLRESIELCVDDRVARVASDPGGQQDRQHCRGRREMTHLQQRSH